MLIVGVSEEPSTGHHGPRDNLVAKSTVGDRPISQRNRSKRKFVEKYITMAQCVGERGRQQGGQGDANKKSILHFVTFFFFSDHSKNPCAYNFLFPLSRDAFGKLAALL
jgi:hypothetical protein